MCADPSASAGRQMALVAFLQAANCSNYPASWRHPETAPDFLSAEYYQRIARILEAGKFHMAFFDDRLAMPGRYGDDEAEAIRNGIRVVKMDLIPPMTAMGLATQHLGVGGTYSTTYFEPFHVARVFATLDHMLGGRAAWNVVTSLNDSEAANFGQAAHLGHDERYDRADEFMDTVFGHWDSWEDGAIVQDKGSGTFGIPEKVHRLDHEGAHFGSRGPFTVPRTPQGRPVIIQAGQSGRGRRLAARWADLVFIIERDLDIARREYRAFKDAVAEAGRDPTHVNVLLAAYCITGETSAIAAEKAAYLEGLAEPIDTLVLLSEVLNYDFARKDMDEPFTDEELAAISGVQALRDQVLRGTGKQHPTTRDFVEFSGQGTVRQFTRFVGSPSEIADRLEEWFGSEACDGFVVAATHMPGAYEDFVRLVVPELQRRGLFHQDYAGMTLRENLRLPRPERGDWVTG